MTTPAMIGPAIALTASICCCEGADDPRPEPIPELVFIVLNVSILAILMKSAASAGNGKIKHDKNEIIVMA